MKKLRMGVIGCGNISSFHIKAYQENENTELAALCDTDEPWLKCAGELYGVEKLYTSYEQMLEEEKLDGVSVCLPTWLHAPASIAALERGVHVLCEKPMTINAAEGRRMREAEKKGGGRLMISQNQRFEQSVQLLKMLHEQGEYGDVYQVRLGWRRTMGQYPTPHSRRPNGMTYSHNWFNERDKGGGVLRDLGSHLLDLTMYILDFPALEGVLANSCRKFIPPIPDPEKHIFDSEDFTAAYLKFAGGIGVQLELSFGSLIENDALFTRIYGTKLGAHRFDSSRVILVRPTPDGKYMSEEVLHYPAAPQLHPSYYFTDALLNDKPIPVPSDQGLRVIEIIDALYESSGSGQ